MTLRRLMFSLSLAGLASQAVAQHSAVENLVQSCIKATRAPGSYAIASVAPLPAVTPANGGSQLGAHNVNDCLQDSYQVQYDSRVNAVQADADFDAPSAKDCENLAAESFFVSTFLTVGTAAAIGATAGGAAILGGWIGTLSAHSAHTGCLGRLGRDQHGKTISANTRRPGCADLGSGMIGGSGYCTD